MVSTGPDLNGVFRFVLVLFFASFCPFSRTSLPKRKTKRSPKSSKTAFRFSPVGKWGRLFGPRRGPPGGGRDPWGGPRNEKLGAPMSGGGASSESPPLAP